LSKRKFEQYEEQGKIPEMNEIVFEDVVKILIDKTDFKPRFMTNKLTNITNKEEKEE